MTKILTWHDVLSNEKQQSYFINILDTIAAEKQAGFTIYPKKKDIFNAFRFTELSKIKVVILGQDPYHGPGQAHGLAFSVRFGVIPPPSLLSIYKELENSIPGFIRPTHGCLKSWALQGVMLLNSVLTVRADQAHSHANLGWEIFTDKVISLINKHHKWIVFLLWGSHAQKKEAIIDRNRHYVLKAPHPSPFSAYRGFFGCNHFMITNQRLKEQGKKPIDWIPRITN